MREITGKTWKKEDELKQLKSEVAVLERKIQLELKVPESPIQKAEVEMEQVKNDTVVSPVLCSSTPVANAPKGFKI